MDDFEKLGAFFLGRPYDLAAGTHGAGAVLYDSTDLVTHAVCVGMTGSGKTGLCIDLLEEAAIDGVPAIVIDPKGDLANLLLTFPGLAPEEFAPWLSPDLVNAPGADRAALAATEAQRWKDGLAEWGQDAARVARLRASADFAIYTPGSDAGLPLSVLGSFAPPVTGDDREAFADAVAGTATGLLALIGVDADPLTSREHILVSTILATAWQRGESLDLAGLIGQVQAPPFARVGVLDLDAFFPQKERFGLAMRINNLLAAPGFDLWLQGDPLDVQRLLFTPEGRPRVSVISIAHLSDAERMFIVTLLLQNAVTWMRRQPGTSSLRALLYMDEVFGYFPPVAEPPSKKPLLTLLKQARAAGFGIVLATQNPADLDYKGLGNTGTWLIGRLQAERDKARLLDGLEGAAPGAFDRAELDRILSSLKKRVFLLHDVHEAAPVVFETRWALSYLRGPLTRDEVKALMADRRAAAVAAAPPVVAPPAPVAAPAPAVPAPAAAPAGDDRLPPALAPGIDRYVLPARGLPPADAELVYAPLVLGAATVALRDDRAGVDELRQPVLVVAPRDGAVPVDWSLAEPSPVPLAEIGRDPAQGARFLPVTGALAQARAYAGWKGDLADLLYRTQAVDLLRAPRLKLVSKPGEAEGDFRARIGLALREERDAKVDALRRRYAPRVAALEERLRRAQAVVDREEGEARSAQVNVALEVGASILGSLFGRRSSTSTAARRAGKAFEQSGDVARARADVEALTRQLQELEAEASAETADLDARIDPLTEAVEPLQVRPRRADVNVILVALVLAPHWRDGTGALTPAWR